MLRMRSLGMVLPFVPEAPSVGAGITPWWKKPIVWAGAGVLGLGLAVLLFRRKAAK